MESSGRSRTTDQMATFQKFFSSYLSDRLTHDESLISRQRKAAQEKLARLTRTQFHELATDVYDEANRRKDSSNELPFLPVRQEFHPKRNQARQKLATLPEQKFKDLATDVMFELERRFPESFTPATNEEEKINSIPKNDYESKIKDLESKLAQMETKNTNNSEFIKLKDQVLDQKMIIENQESVIQELQQSHKKAVEDYQKQQQLAEQIRQDSDSLVKEVKTLTKKIDLLEREREMDKANIATLIDEKSNLDIALKAAQMELKRMRNTSEATSPAHESVASPKSPMVSFDAETVSSYLVAVDHLQQAAQNHVASEILDAMKSIVLSSRQISDAADSFEKVARGKNIISATEADRFRNLRNQLSTQLSSLITVAKQAATNPSSDSTTGVENTSQKLTTVVVDLVECIKNIQKFSGKTENSEFNTLKVDLEKETDTIVHSIQDLLVAMKTSSEPSELREMVESICEMVDRVYQLADSSLDKPFMSSYQRQATQVLINLQECNDHIRDFFDSQSSEFVGEIGPLDKATKQKIASSAYEVAKSTKDLLILFDRK